MIYNLFIRTWNLLNLNSFVTFNLLKNQNILQHIVWITHLLLADLSDSRCVNLSLVGTFVGPPPVPHNRCQFLEGSAGVCSRSREQQNGAADCNRRRCFGSTWRRRPIRHQRQQSLLNSRRYLFRAFLSPGIVWYLRFTSDIFSTTKLCDNIKLCKRLILKTH